MASDAIVFDAIIIGAGPAGLSAGTYLGRFRRRFLILEDGNSRARWIPTSHNIPGFAAGVGGEELLSRLARQAKKYGAQIRNSNVTTIAKSNDRFNVTTAACETFVGRYLLLATGTRDHMPDLPRWRASTD